MRPEKNLSKGKKKVLGTEIIDMVFQFLSPQVTFRASLFSLTTVFLLVFPGGFLISLLLTEERKRIFLGEAGKVVQREGVIGYREGKTYSFFIQKIVP